MNCFISKVCLLALLAQVWPMLAQDSVVSLAGQPLVSGGTNGSGTNALFNDPAALVTDASGNVFVADSRNHAIRKVGTNGSVTTFAGQLGVSGSSNGTGAQAQFNNPCGIARDKNGNFFVADTGNHTIRKITPAGVVSTFAGSAGQSGFTNATGAAARFNAPLGIAVSTNGTVYVADCGNHLIRAISAGGAVSTLAGSPENWGSDDGLGSAARFNGPVGLALDDAGNLLVADSNNHTIRKVTPAGAVTTWAGAAGADGCMDGDAGAARFSKPAELAIDRKGNLFVADSFNHVVRKVSPDRHVSTITGAAGNTGSADGANGAARLFNPYGLAVAPDGSLLLADAYNELIRVVFVPFNVNLQHSGASASLAWDSVIGKKYQVQSRGELDFGAWSDVGAPLAATNLTTMITDNAGTAARKIYRVQLLP